MPKIFSTFDGDMEGDPIVNLGAGVQPGDAVTKGQLDAKLDASEKGQPGGIATLDAMGKVPASQLDVQATFDGDMQGAPLVNLAAGMAATDAVNKGQMDAELATKLDASEKGQANGVASLNASGTVPTAQIPPLAYVPNAEKGQADGVATLNSAGKVPASQLPATTTPVIVLSGTDHGAWIDLDSTAEQTLQVPHGHGAVPPEREVFFEPVADVGLDVDAVCLDHVKYLEAQSSATEMAFAVKLREGSGTPGQQGQLRILTFAA